MYERIKAIAWPHLVVPFVAMIVLEYAELMARLAQIMAASWIVVLALGFVVGLWAQFQILVSEASPWSHFFNMRVSKAIPSIGWGSAIAKWASSTEEVK